MGIVAKSCQVPVSADSVWNLVGDWNGLAKWHPWCQSSELQSVDAGVRRYLQLTFGWVIEDLVYFDAVRRIYTYKIVESPLPFSFYHGTVQVRDLDAQQSEVVFFVQFTSRGMSETEGSDKISSFIAAGLENLQKILV